LVPIRTNRGGFRHGLFSSEWSRAADSDETGMDSNMNPATCTDLNPAGYSDLDRFQRLRWCNM
jgi:hypothetical protein